MNIDNNELDKTGESPRDNNKRIDSLIDNLVPILKILYLRKKFILISEGIIAIASFIILWFVIPSTYEVTVTVLPETMTSSTLSALSGLASSVGVNLNTGGATTIYSNLLLSEAVLEPVILDKYRIPGEKDSANLIDIFEIEPVEDYPLPTQKRLQFISCYEMLAEKGGIVSELDAATGALSILVTMPAPKLAAEVANNLLISLDDYMKNKRQSSAKNSRMYLEGRVAALLDSLTQAENKLKKFNEQNRMIAQSPQLLLEQSRLQRNVQVYNTTYSTLRSSLEAAKLEEVKDVPVVNIREWAKDPVTSSGPHRTIFFVIIIVFTFGLICFSIILRPRVIYYSKLIRGKN